MKKYICKFCGGQSYGSEIVEEDRLVKKVVPHRPEGWRSIDFDLWCGSCDPRKEKINAKA